MSTEFLRVTIETKCIQIKQSPKGYTRASNANTHTFPSHLPASRTKHQQLGMNNWPLSTKHPRAPLRAYFTLQDSRFKPKDQPAPSRRGEDHLSESQAASAGSPFDMTKRIEYTRTQRAHHKYKGPSQQWFTAYIFPCRTHYEDYLPNILYVEIHPSP
ncbi:uncharacterized protein CLUP02_12954 [Colletotrichum lupini]|uniref:Uncharacterized protein n=1 Tax=Colletotrichum lupini TaxID=145971 RepID=A0A9Q8T1C0_9PEZI|nr:uncharacterized protein CLUP02_12954 [Colletotrichum lupini]UQC87449.1 hypothetical protein CLUP02_12954 [Colletotrichum lupini]